VKGARVVANVLQKAQKAEPEIEALSIFFSRRPLSLSAEPSRLGLAAQAVNDADGAAGANGINITLDQQLIADIRAWMDAIEQYAKTAGVPKPAATVAAK